MSEEEKKPVCGPVCEVCGESKQWLVPILVKREMKGRYEMVKIHLCLFHFYKEMEDNDETPPEEKRIPEDEDDDAWEDWEEDQDSEYKPDTNAEKRIIEKE